MENLAPPLEWVMQIRSDLESGLSMLRSIHRGLEKRRDDFSAAVKRCLSDGEVASQQQFDREMSVYRQALLHLIRQGLAGQSVLPQLRELEKEIIDASELEMEKHFAVLPIRVMLIVLCFQFPGFLILLLSPLINEFLKGF
jgi:hypothetical protein